MNHSHLKRLLKGRRALLTLSIAGFVILLVAIALGPGPKKSTAKKSGPVVATLQVEPQMLRPKAIAYGEVQANIDWQAYAEIGGRIVFQHPELEDGNTLAAGTEVLRIDPRDYELAVQQAEAKLAVSQSQLGQLKREYQHSRERHGLAKKRLAIVGSELARKQKLLKQGSLPLSQVDQERQNQLNAKLDLEQLASELHAFPERISAAEAQLNLDRAGLEEQERRLERASIKLPFDARIGKVHTELDQWVSPQQALFSAFDLERVEIPAQLPISHMRPLVTPGQGHEGLPLAASTLKTMGLTATARWKQGGMENIEWPAEVLRVSDTLDPQTRSLTVVVSVDRPYQQMQAGKRPPLFKGMYLEVEFSGSSRKLIAIPRSALHQGTVFLAEQGHLVKRPVTIDFYQGDLAIIASGLSGGEELILDDPMPAIEGMAIRTVAHNPQHTDDRESTR